VGEGDKCWLRILQGFFVFVYVVILPCSLRMFLVRGTEASKQEAACGIRVGNYKAP
jgi:hypothetical protein